MGGGGGGGVGAGISLQVEVNLISITITATNTHVTYCLLDSKAEPMIDGKTPSFLIFSL